MIFFLFIHFSSLNHTVSMRRSHLSFLAPVVTLLHEYWSFLQYSGGYFLRALLSNSVSLSRGLITVTAFVWLLFPNMFSIWTMDTFHKLIHTYTPTYDGNKFPYLLFAARLLLWIGLIETEYMCNRERKRLREPNEKKIENAFVITFEQSEYKNENEKWIYLIRLKSCCLCSSSTPSISFNPLFKGEQWKQTYYYSAEHPDFYLTLWMKNKPMKWNVGLGDIIIIRTTNIEKWLCIVLLVCVCAHINH